jgi:acetylornithine deacetylase/succinyl-diaminopimelate desuccinylase-like protein
MSRHRGLGRRNEPRALDETAELVEELLAGAGFETRQLRSDGSAAAVYGDQPGRTDFTLLLYNHFYAGSRAHAPNEHIRLDDVQPALRFTYALMRDLGAEPGSRVRR